VPADLDRRVDQTDDETDTRANRFGRVVRKLGVRPTGQLRIDAPTCIGDALALELPQFVHTGRRN